MEPGVIIKMMLAARSGDLVEIKKVTTLHGPSIDEASYNAALYEALSHSQQDIAEFLLKLNFELSDDISRFPFLHEAVAKNHLLIVKLLLPKVNVNARNSAGDTPLHCAVAKGFLPITKLLLRTADANAIDLMGLTPLHLAVRYENVQLARCLIDHGAKVDIPATGKPHEGKTPLLFVTTNISLKMVQLLLNRGANINANCHEGTLLHVACREEFASLVQCLVERGSNVEAEDKDGKTPIYYAVESGRVDIIKMLLDGGATLKPYPGQLIDSIGHRSTELLDILLKYGSDVNEKLNDETALHRAIISFSFIKQESSLATVEWLLANGADVNAKTGGQTALMLALTRGRFRAIPILLDYKADFKMSSDRKSLLHLCVEGGCTAEAVKSVLERGADVNARAANGETLLHMAAAGDDDELCKVLLQWKGVDIDATDEEGCTALFRAVDGINLNSVLPLLLFGADINITNNNGLTPLQIANAKLSAGPYSDPRKGHFGLHYGYNSSDSDSSDSNLTVWYSSESDSDKTLADNAMSSRAFRDLSEIAEFLRSHAAKLKIANLHVCEENLRFVDYIVKPPFVTDCEKEIERMKNEKFVNTCISYYDLLSRSNNQVAMYSQNSVVSHVLDSEDCDDIFPLYGHLIKFRFKRGKERVELLKSSIMSLGIIFDFLPFPCIDLLTDFLSNENLKKFFVNEDLH